MSLDKTSIPDELTLLKHRLSPRFFEVRTKVIDFILEEIIPALPAYEEEMKTVLATVDHPTKAPRPPIVKALQKKAKEKGLYNFFLPEVSKISVLEYSP